MAALFNNIDTPINAVVFNPGANVKHPLAETEAWLFELDLRPHSETF